MTANTTLRIVLALDPGRFLPVGRRLRGPRRRRGGGGRAAAAAAAPIGGGGGGGGAHYGGGGGGGDGAAGGRSARLRVQHARARASPAAAGSTGPRQSFNRPARRRQRQDD